MGRLKAGSPFIFDDDVDRPIGFRAPDGTETYFPQQTRERRSNTGAFLGSSTMARQSNINGYRAKGNFVQANIRAGWPLKIVGNFGVEGDTVPMMLARIDQVLASGAAYCIMELGFNDINGGRALADVKADTLTLLNKLEDACIGPIILSMHPSDLLDTAAKQAKAVEYVEWLRKLCFLNGWEHYDQNSSLIDPATGGLKTGYATDSPRHHFNGRGAAVAGVSIAAGLSEKFRPQWPILNQFDYYNLFPNPCMQGANASGTVGSGTTIATLTGTGPDGAAITVSNATGTAVSQARADGLSGNVCKLTATNSANNGFVAMTYTVRVGASWLANTAYSRGFYRLPTVANGYMYKVVTNGTTDATTEPTWPTQIGATVTDGTVVWRCYPQLRAGHTVYALAELVECAIASGAANAYLLVECQNSGGTILLQRYCNYLDPGETGEAYPETVAARNLLMTPEFTLPENTDRLVVKVLMQGANGAQYTLGVGHIGIRFAE